MRDVADGLPDHAVEEFEKHNAEEDQALGVFQTAAEALKSKPPVKDRPGSKPMPANTTALNLPRML